jgi:4-hydroxy-tetrahydrodipicolinate synthase
MVKNILVPISPVDIVYNEQLTKSYKIAQKYTINYIGVYTVLVTPFANENTIDFNSICNWLICQYDENQSRKIAGLVLLGTTSESPVLTLQEKLDIIEYVYNYNLKQKNKKFLVVGVGGNFTQEVVEFTEHIKDYVDGIMVTVPYYNKPPQRGISAHFKYIANKFPELPIMMYNVPGRTCVNMEPETMIDVINSCPNVVALKEANGDIKATEKLVELLKNTNRTLGDTFKIFSGDDINVVKHCVLGASGVISVASNIIPKQISNVVSLCLNKNFESADTELSKYSEFIKYLFIETNPIPIKEIMHNTNIYTTNNMRLPLVTMDKEKSNILTDMFYKLQ